MDWVFQRQTVFRFMKHILYEPDVLYVAWVTASVFVLCMVVFVYFRDQKYSSSTIVSYCFLLCVVIWCMNCEPCYVTTQQQQQFNGPLSGTIQWAGIRRKHSYMPSSGFCGAGEDNRGRLTDNLAGRHSIWTTGAPTSTISTIFMPDALTGLGGLFIGTIHICDDRRPYCQLLTVALLLQPSQFILVWDRHQICWVATQPIYPGLGQAPNMLGCIPGCLVMSCHKLSVHSVFKCNISELHDSILQFSYTGRFAYQ